MSLPPERRSASIPLRFSFAPSPTGDAFVCLLVRGPEEPIAIERRSTVSGAATELEVPGLGLHAQLLPLSDGSTLVCSHDGGAHHVNLVRTTATGTSVRRLVTVTAPALRILPAGPLAGALAVVACGERDGSTSLRQLTPTGLATTGELRLPGLFTGGTWVDARHLAGDLAVQHRPPDGVLVDLAAGTWRTEFRVSDATSDRIIGGTEGLLVTQTNAGGVERIGYGPDGARQRFPECLLSAGRDLRLLAVARDRMLVAAETGARHRLFVVDSHSDRASDVPVGPGVAFGPAAVNGGVAWFPWSDAGTPAGIRGIELGRGRPVRRNPPRGQVPCARLERLPGAAGPLEAVVYGDPNAAETVVLALHGGPLAAWTVGFDPLLASLAEAGAAVVALNQRGSTGYGLAHAVAIRGAWGGPDLDDVLSVASELRARRSPLLPLPVILGTSYGGFLALLAAALEPAAWARCVALSAFTSGPRLDRATGGPVTVLLRRLGGLEPFRDNRGVRDAYERATTISAPLLLVHGDRDDVVPVSEARALADRIRTQVPQAGLTYLEVPQAGHDLTSSRHRQSVIPTVVRYCRAAPPLRLPQADPPTRAPKGGEEHDAHHHSSAGAAR